MFFKISKILKFTFFWFFVHYNCENFVSLSFHNFRSEKFRKRLIKNLENLKQPNLVTWISPRTTHVQCNNAKHPYKKFANSLRSVARIFCKAAPHYSHILSNSRATYCLNYGSAEIFDPNSFTLKIFTY